MKDAELTDHARLEGGQGCRCRFCGGKLAEVLDLGMSPLCESFLPADRLDAMEAFYPLRVQVCADCWLMQLRQYVSPGEIFSEYAYFSSYSDAYVGHARAYVDAAVARLGLDSSSRVVELASNDGYLLRHFVPHGVPVLGIEPAANVAEAARARGVPTVVEFFGTALARRLDKADLVIANNVLAQVPHLNDFVAGIGLLLSPTGVATVEFPHLLTLIENTLYDTIYHEHFSYFSLLAAQRIFAAHGMTVFDVEEIWTHGGSLRLHLCRREVCRRPGPAVERVLARERQAGLESMEGFAHFADKVRLAKFALLDFLIGARRAGKRVVAYGAPGKGNTLLNHCGIRTDFIDYAVDRNPYKHGRFTPGTHIPIHPPARLRETRPDYVLILPWNLADEIRLAHGYVREWGGRFVVPLPEVSVLP